MMRITLRGCPPSLNQFVGKVNGNEYRAAKSQWTRTVYYLTKAGVIVDDDMAHIRLHIGGGYDKRQPRTVITVKETEE